LPAAYAQWVDLPRKRRQRGDAEVVDNRALAHRGVIQHVNERRRRLVVHRPAAVEENELLGGDEAAHGRLRCRRLRLEPDLKISLFDIRKAALRVLQQAGHDGRKDARHVAAADGAVALVILHVGFIPAHIIVRVRRDVHVDDGRRGRGREAQRCQHGELGHNSPSSVQLDWTRGETTRYYLFEPEPAPSRALVNLRLYNTR
jgi:hypothetical protein